MTEACLWLSFLLLQNTGEKHLEAGRFAPAQCLGVQSVTVARSWWQEVGPADHAVTSVRSLNLNLNLNSSVQLISSFPFSLERSRTYSATVPLPS